jgi:hypothetical protein
MDEEVNYENIIDLLNNIPDNFNILEETIDVEVQRDYFESAKDIAPFDQNEIDEMINVLDKNELSVDESKTLLQKLASVENVAAFRALERYVQNPAPELKDWAVLALQQSRMVLQSSLFDEQQVFISTGLGGKNNKLRYFLIIPFKNVEDKQLTETQKSILEKELKYFSEHYDAEFESIEFYDKFAVSLMLFPLKAEVSQMIQQLLDECNQYGDYISENIIITNIKKYNYEEIVELLKNYENEHED